MMDGPQIQVRRRRRWGGPARLRPQARRGRTLSEMAEDLSQQTGLPLKEAEQYLQSMGHRPPRARAA